jgi:hypothetical protein
MSINTPQYERHAGSGQVQVEVIGSFGLTTDGAVTAVRGRGFTVAKVAATTGQYTVTLDRAYPECISKVVSLSNATASDYSVQGGSYVTTTGVWTIFVSDSDDTSGIPAVADLSGPRIEFRMSLTKYAVQVTP